MVKSGTISMKAVLSKLWSSHLRTLCFLLGFIVLCDCDVCICMCTVELINVGTGIPA